MPEFDHPTPLHLINLNPWINEHSPNVNLGQVLYEAAPRGLPVAVEQRAGSPSTWSLEARAGTPEAFLDQNHGERGPPPSYEEATGTLGHHAEQQAGDESLAHVPNLRLLDGNLHLLPEPLGGLFGIDGEGHDFHRRVPSPRRNVEE